MYEGRPVEIETVLGMDKVQIKDLVSLEHLQVPIAGLAPRGNQVNPPSSYNLDLTEHACEHADSIIEIISPLLSKPNRTREDVKKRAAEFNYAASTLYTWIAAYDGTPATLARKERSDKGTKRLDPRVEAIISNTLSRLGAADTHVTNIHKKIKEQIEPPNRGDDTHGTDVHGERDGDIASECTALAVPSIGTIRNRYYGISPKQREKQLHGSYAAEHLYDPIRASFPDADYPLHTVQIDHVLLDILVVDETTRQAIQRPWMTLTFDVFSRMVTGFVESLDPPGLMSTGDCIVNSIFPKEEWLSKIGSSAKWPVWGKMVCLHGDNAFRAGSLKKTCHDHGIELIWRPVKKPHFGGHIERWCGTLAQSIHCLPGTTFANPEERGTYDSEDEACFTLPELHAWLVERIAEYHAQVHSQLGMPPLKRFETGLFKGTDEHPPVGLQDRIVDAKAQTRLRLDFMPTVERTIQRYGVEIEKVTYYHDVLRRWINAKDPQYPTQKRMFRFKRFRRDISSIWFFDPELEDYFEIPTRDTTFPSMSIWDLHKVRRHAKAEGKPNREVNQDYIKARHVREREIEDQAVKKTKAARKQNERRKYWEASPKPRLPSDLQPPLENETAEEAYEPVEEFTEND
jgi:putative transposase